MTVNCDRCNVMAQFSVTAAAMLPSGPGIRPAFRCYPAPMAHLCGWHLAGFLSGDAAEAGSTEAWLVQTIPDPEPASACDRGICCLNLGHDGECES